MKVQHQSQNHHSVSLVYLVELDPKLHRAPRARVFARDHGKEFAKDHGMVYAKDHGMAFVHHSLVFGCLEVRNYFLFYD